MTENTLLSLQGSFVIGVDADIAVTKYKLTDLVRAKKEANGITSTNSYDFNGSGATDAEDIQALRKALLGIGREV